MRLHLLFACSLALLVGCTADKPTLSQATQPARRARIGEVYLVRGLLGVFSTGMDRIGGELRDEGVPAAVIMHTAGADAASAIAADHVPGTPVIIVGHSLGADEAVSIARRLNDQKVTVDLLVTLDPVDAPRVPPNVLHAVNYYRSGAFDFLPAFRGTPLHADSPAHLLTNLDLNDNPRLLEAGTNHFTIDKNTLVQKDIVQRILEICPPSGQSEAVVTKARLSPASGSPNSAASVQVPRQYH